MDFVVSNELVVLSKFIGNSNITKLVLLNITISVHELFHELPKLLFLEKVVTNVDRIFLGFCKTLQFFFETNDKFLMEAVLTYMFVKDKTHIRVL